MVMKFLKDILTGIDNETWDLGRILLAMGCLLMIAGGIDMMIDGQLDVVGFGAGFGGLLTGGGALLILKSSTEPNRKVTKEVEVESDETSATVKVEEKR